MHPCTVVGPITGWPTASKFRLSHLGLVMSNITYKRQACPSPAGGIHSKYCTPFGQVLDEADSPRPNTPNDPVTKTQNPGQKGRSWNLRPLM